jgi:small subunit ribosomal protein S14
MSKKCLIERNKKRVALTNKLQSKRKQLKDTIYNKQISIEERYDLIMKLSLLPRNSSKSRIRNRCVLTGRPRGCYRKVGLSRNMFRELAGKGAIPGIVKSSW